MSLVSMQDLLLWLLLGLRNKEVTPNFSKTTLKVTKTCVKLQKHAKVGTHPQKQVAYSAENPQPFRF